VSSLRGHTVEAVHRILGSQKGPLTLSPVGDVWSPTWLKLSSSQSRRRLLSDLMLKHTPVSRRHKDPFNRFIYRSFIFKDDMIEAGLPVRWGFDGIGPLRFRDMDDLMIARKAIDQRLYLIGSLTFPTDREGISGSWKIAAGIMLTSQSKWRVQHTVDHPDLSSKDSLLIDSSGDSPTERG
jgi:hypothetical protein